MKQVSVHFMPFVLRIFLTAFTLHLVLYSIGQSPQSRLWTVPPNQVKFPSLTVGALPSSASNLPAYNGTSVSSYANNAMHDADGNLLFFIVDGSVYDKNGLLIGNISIYPVSIGSPVQVTGTTEWLIVPVPGNCRQFYLIGGIYESPSTNGGSPRPYYITLDLSLQNLNQAGTSNPNATGDFVDNDNTATLLDDGSAAPIGKSSCLHFAVTPLRNDPNAPRFLYINHGYNGKITRFRITSAGIFWDNNYTYIIPGSAFLATIRAEMELVQLASGNYRISLPFQFDQGFPLPPDTWHVIYVADIDYATGNILSSTAKFFDLPHANQSMALPYAKAHGLEFSTNGQYLYVTHTEKPYMQYVDLVSMSAFAPLGVVTTPQISTAQWQDFEFTQIELGNDGRLYFGASNRMASLDITNASAPVGSIWNNLVIGPAGPLPGVPISTGTFSSSDIGNVRLLNDQIDGEVYQSYAQASPPSACCILNSAFVADNYMVGTGTQFPSTTQTWTTTNNPFGNIAAVTIRNSLLIPSGFNITIQGMTFKFAPETSAGTGAKVEIERGATLILDNTTFTAYDDCGNGMWQGIEVWGNAIALQTDLSGQGQGRVIITNNSIIENAFEGITTIRTDASGNQDWTYTGGIVRANNSIFRNCFRGAQFLPYKLQNTSYFRNCTFETTGLLSNPAIMPYAFVSLYDVTGVQFQGCTFQNLSPSSFAASDRGMGIVSLDAKYSVQPGLNNLPCSFNNLNYGIHCSNTLSLNSVYITESDFITNNHGIYLSSVGFPTIISNKFDVGLHPDQEPYGLYLDHCSGYHVEDNEFYSTQNGTGYGTIVNNAAKKSNRIYRNKFHDNSINFQYQGLATSVPPTNLQVKCNDFSQSSTSNVNIAVTSGAIGDQGSCSASTTTPAGNLFGPCFTPIPPFPPNFTHIWTNTIGVVPFTYYPHPDPSPFQTVPTCYDPGIVTVATPCSTPYSANSCPSTLDFPCNPDCLRQKVNEAAEQMDTLVSQSGLIGAASDAYEFAVSDLVRHRLRDTALANSMDSIVDFLLSQTTLSSKLYLLEAYLTINQCSEARIVYDVVRPHMDTLYNRMADIMITLCETDRTIFELTAEEKEFVNLMTAEVPHDAAIIARNILETVDGVSFYENIEDLQFALNDLRKTGVDMPVPGQSVLSISPNPSHGAISVRCNFSAFFPDQEGTSGKLKIYNVLGIKVAEYDLPGSGEAAGSLTISSTELSEGIYFCSGEFNGREIYKDKIIILK